MVLERAHIETGFGQVDAIHCQGAERTILAGVFATRKNGQALLSKSKVVVLGLITVLVFPVCNHRLAIDPRIKN